MIWGVPSAIALVIKCMLFFYSDVYKQKNFFTFLLMTFWLNSVELLLFFRLGYDLEVLKLYYCAVIFTVFYIAIVCSDISQSARWINHNFVLIGICSLAAITYFTDYIVLGSKPMPNGSITKISGSYYFIIQLYFIGTLLFAFGLLLKGFMQKSNYHLKSCCIVTALAFTPYMLSIITIIILMQLGYRINVVGFSSLAICFMLMVFIAAKDKHKLFSMMSFIPFSREWDYRIKIKNLMQKFHGPMHGERVDMKDLIKELETLVIDQTKHYFSTQKELAKMFNISESSLSRKKMHNKNKS